MFEFGILGPLEVSCAGRLVRLPGSASRRVLAALVLRVGEWQSVDRLIDELGGERPPRLARKALQMHISRLRAALAAAAPDAAQVLASGPGGYRLAVGKQQVDAARCARLVEEGRGALAGGDPRRARELLEQALGLWRGTPLAELALDGAFAADLARLEELRLAALEQRIAALLALGLVDEAIGDSQRLVADHPWRERLHAQLMRALYRAGRQVEALEAYRRARAILVDQLGIEPGPELRDLERQILQQDLSVEASPPPAPARRANLPLAPTPFLGRARELGEITALLRENNNVRLLTLTGAGGSGKTRLAVRVAEACADDYRDGVWFVGLADVTDPGLIASTICQAVGLTERPDLTHAQRLTDWLGGRELLLLLDNLEQLVDGTAVLGRLLSSCLDLTLLVTSREPLRLAAEHQYDVPVLEHADAVELFMARARAVAPGRVVDPELAGSVCERLDCLPLAIELAAARTKILPAAEILARLDSRMPLLTGGPRDAPQRQRTLRATIDWSHGLLNREDQRLFARLAVFAGGCTLTAAQQVCGAKLDTLQTLVDRSLLLTDGKRYWMLQTVHEYAHEQLDYSPEAEEIRRGHATWFVDLLGAEGVAPPGWPTCRALERLGEEQLNFRKALEWTQAVGANETLARLASALTALWVMRGQLHEAQRWITTARQHEDAYPALLAAQVFSAGRTVAQHRGDWVNSAALGRRALELWQAIGDPAPIGRAMTWAASDLAQLSGDAAAARPALEQAIRFAREHDLPEALSLGLINLSDTAIKQRNLTEGRALCEEGLAVSEPGSQLAVVALINLAHIEMVENHPVKAARLYRQALVAAHQRSDHLWVAWATIGSAWPLAKQNQLERSGRLLGAALAFLDTAGGGRDWMVDVWENAICTILSKQLGVENAQAVVNQGRNLPLDEAARIALDALAAGT